MPQTLAAPGPILRALDTRHKPVPSSLPGPWGGHRHGDPAHRELQAHATALGAKATSAARADWDLQPGSCKPFVHLSGLALSGSWEASCLGLYPGNCKAFARLTRPCLALRELLPMSLEVVYSQLPWCVWPGAGSQGTTSPSHISCGLALSANGTGTSEKVAHRQQIWLVLWAPQLLRRV